MWASGRRYATASQTASDYITRSTRPSRFFACIGNVEKHGKAWVRGYVHVHDNYANETSIQDHDHIIKLNKSACILCKQQYSKVGCATILQSRMCIIIQSLCGLFRKLIGLLFAKQLTWHASIMHIKYIILLKRMSGSVK